MKVIRKFLLLTCLVGAVSCVKENFENCPKTGNMTLFFTYSKTNGGADVFSTYIKSVDAFIFDSDKNMYDERKFVANDLNVKVKGNSPGWKLVKMPPGDYYAVCWGNVGGGTGYNRQVKDITPFDACIISIPTSNTSSGDPIYYAPAKTNPFQDPDTKGGPLTLDDFLETKASDPAMQLYHFSVIEGVDGEKEMPFICAHRTINVYIVGYAGQVTSQSPVVQATSLGTQYNFNYTSRHTVANFTQPARTGTTPAPDSRTCLVASFYFAFDEITDDMVVKFKPTVLGASLEEINILEFINANGLDINANVINIVIEYFELGVRITSASWPEVPVYPRP